MIDGGASVIVTIAGLGYAIVSGTRLFITPQKKIDRLEGALHIANKMYLVVKKKMSAEEAFLISDHQKKLIDELATLDKTRWGHLRNLRKYVLFKKNVKIHCATVKRMSREYLAAREVAEAAERVAREREEKAAAQEEETTKKRLQMLERDLCALLNEKYRRRVLTRDLGQPGTSKSSSTAATLTSPIDLLNTSNTSLPIPVMNPHSSHTPRPDDFSSELRGLVLDEDLIDFSDTSLNLGQRDGILIDLSTDDAGSLHRLLSSDSDISYLEGMNLLSTLLDSPWSAIRIPAEASHPNETPMSGNAAPSASGTSTPVVSAVPEQGSQNHHTPPKSFGTRLNQLVEDMRTASNYISASTDLYEAFPT
ncbi:hypothetical protein ARMGADRAFT_1060683 [Armillaria gallica]|uniref:Uncharacterized protein n=1 Tax=Armillaria gallica TaxID=47427 RepID=A0A2H3E808_ARMGA|nr:hypothetical protein ARMGADRAFT_1060683 [Armillaria gallica]